MDDTRACILQRAGELFSRRGYSAISMREIAEVCGVSKPAIYHHFRGKKELYIEVLERELERLVAELSKAGGASGTIVGRLEAMVRCYLGLLRQKLSLIQLLLRDIGAIETEIPGVVERRREELLQPFRSLLVEGAERGEIRPVDPTLASLSLLGMMNVFVMRSTLQPGMEIGENDMQHTVDFVLNGLLPR